MCRAPYLRASLMAPSLASAPELVKNTWSKQLCSVSAFASCEAGAVVERRARRQQRCGLRGKRIGDGRRRMAEAIDRPALDEVEIALAAVVPQPRAFAADENGRRPGGDFHQCVKRMRGDVHVELLSGFGMQSGPKRKKAALCGCGLLENVADLVLQLCRRTRRDPSSSTERRRKAARVLVRFRIMAQGHTAEWRMLSSGVRIPRRCRAGRTGPRARSSR